jgi:hypothetical protein
MNYLLLIHEPRGQREQRSPQQGRTAYDQMLAFAETLKGEGKLRAVESLQGDERGRRVQVREGQVRLLDGPFTEAKEFVGGFFLVDCGSLDEAVALAERCPAAAWATVEVRPVGPCFL